MQIDKQFYNVDSTWVSEGQSYDIRFGKQVDLAADRKTWENLTDVRLDDLEFATAWNDKSPMHVAIERNHTKCAEYILSGGKGAYHYESTS